MRSLPAAVLKPSAAGMLCLLRMRDYGFQHRQTKVSLQEIPNDIHCGGLRVAASLTESAPKMGLAIRKIIRSCER